MIKINGVTVKSPSTLIPSIVNVGSRVDRNAAGLAVMDRIGRKRRLEIQWNYVTNAELQTIINNAGKTSAFFAVTYFDPEDMADRTITCYAEHFEFKMQRYENGAAVGWEDVRLDLIER